MLSVLVLSLLLTAGRVFGYSLESDWDADFSESAPLDNDIEDHAADAGDVDTDVGFAGQEEWQDPRLLILPVGAGNLLNINTTAALLALLGAAALLSALGFLIYAIVASKLKSAYGGSSYGGGSYYSSGGYGGGGYGGSYGGGGGYGGGSSGGGYGYARSTDQVDWDSLKVLDYLAVMEDMWRKLDIHEPACQKRVLCELHQNEHVLGPAASRIVNAFGYLRYLSLLNLPDSIKSFIDEFQEAADMGRSKAGGDQCAESYDACDFSIKETFLKFLPAPVPQSGEVHHSEGAAVPDDVDNQLHDD